MEAAAAGAAAAADDRALFAAGDAVGASTITTSSSSSSSSGPLTSLLLRADCGARVVAAAAAGAEGAPERDDDAEGAGAASAFDALAPRPLARLVDDMGGGGWWVCRPARSAVNRRAVGDERNSGAERKKTKYSSRCAQPNTAHPFTMHSHMHSCTLILPCYFRVVIFPTDPGTVLSSLLHPHAVQTWPASRPNGCRSAAAAAAHRGSAAEGRGRASHTHTRGCAEGCATGAGEGWAGLAREQHDDAVVRMDNRRASAALLSLSAPSAQTLTDRISAC